MSDFELPSVPDVEQIRRREFPTARRGYDPDHVRDYLYSLAERIGSMEHELKETRASMQQAQASSQEVADAQEVQPEQDPYELFGKRMAALLATADSEGARVIKEAEAEAERTLEEARSEAGRIRADADAHAQGAQAQSGRMLEQARAEAERAMSGLADRRRVLMEQLEDVRSRLLETAKSIEGILEEPDADAPVIIESQASGSPDAPEEVDAPVPGNAWSSASGSDLPDLSGVAFDLDADGGPAEES